MSAEGDLPDRGPVEGRALLGGQVGGVREGVELLLERRRGVLEGLGAGADGEVPDRREQAVEAGEAVEESVLGPGITQRRLPSQVVQRPPDGLAAAVAADLPKACGSSYWRAAGRPDRQHRVVGRRRRPARGRLDAIDAAVTCCRVGIAETGTIVLGHAHDHGRRANMAGA